MLTLTPMLVAGNNSEGRIKFGIRFRTTAIVDALLALLLVHFRPAVLAVAS